MTTANGAARYTTVADAVEGLARRGYGERFRVVDGRLQALGTGQRLGREDLVIREYHRFEGVSDPDDMAIVYAIEGPGGIRGTLTDAFGVYSDPAMSAFLEGVPIRASAG
ncbi:MAG: phosphoribosylpyrophosphate synthetase [Candidatus Rokubacteria bacterium]|nr:phosphoribosylpyrophosphate synthetase [Candidatus Rokubacteria bacterium]